MTSFSGNNGPGRKPYMTPPGVEPAGYIESLEREAHALWQADDYKGAIPLFQRRVALIAFYYGSETIWTAKATGDLAAALLLAGEDADARTWASHSLRAYAKLLQASPQDHDLRLHLKTFRNLFSDVTYDTPCSGIPDLTTGKLLRG